MLLNAYNIKDIVIFISFLRFCEILAHLFAHLSIFFLLTHRNLLCIPNNSPLLNIHEVTILVYDLF